jgi:hypothetical protein
MAGEDVGISVNAKSVEVAEKNVASVLNMLKAVSSQSWVIKIESPGLSKLKSDLAAIKTALGKGSGSNSAFGGIGKSADEASAKTQKLVNNVKKLANIGNTARLQTILLQGGFSFNKDGSINLRSGFGKNLTSNRTIDGRTIFGKYFNDSTYTPKPISSDLQRSIYSAEKLQTILNYINKGINPVINKDMFAQSVYSAEKFQAILRQMSKYYNFSRPGNISTVPGVGSVAGIGNIPLAAVPTGMSSEIAKMNQQMNKTFSKAVIMAKQGGGQSGRAFAGAFGNAIDFAIGGIFIGLFQKVTHAITNMFDLVGQRSQNRSVFEGVFSAFSEDEGKTTFFNTDDVQSQLDNFFNAIDVETNRSISDMESLLNIFKGGALQGTLQPSLFDIKNLNVNDLGENISSNMQSAGAIALRSVDDVTQAFQIMGRSGSVLIRDVQDVLLGINGNNRATTQVLKVLGLEWNSISEKVNETEMSEEFKKQAEGLSAADAHALAYLKTIDKIFTDRGVLAALLKLPKSENPADVTRKEIEGMNWAALNEIIAKQVRVGQRKAGFDLIETWKEPILNFAQWFATDMSLAGTAAGGKFADAVRASMKLLFSGAIFGIIKYFQTKLGTSFSGMGEQAMQNFLKGFSLGKITGSTGSNAITQMGKAGIEIATDGALVFGAFATVAQKVAVGLISILRALGRFVKSAFIFSIIEGFIKGIAAAGTGNIGSAVETLTQLFDLFNNMNEAIVTSVAQALGDILKLLPGFNIDIPDGIKAINDWLHWLASSGSAAATNLRRIIGGVILFVAFQKAAKFVLELRAALIALKEVEVFGGLASLLGLGGGAGLKTRLFGTPAIPGRVVGGMVPGAGSMIGGEAATAGLLTGTTGLILGIVAAIAALAAVAYVFDIGGFKKFIDGLVEGFKEWYEGYKLYNDRLEELRHPTKDSDKNVLPSLDLRLQREQTRKAWEDFYSIFKNPFGTTGGTVSPTGQSFYKGQNPIEQMILDAKDTRSQAQLLADAKAKYKRRTGQDYGDAFGDLLGGRDDMSPKERTAWDLNEEKEYLREMAEVAVALKSVMLAFRWLGEMLVNTPRKIGEFIYGFLELVFGAFETIIGVATLNIPLILDGLHNIYNGFVDLINSIIDLLNNIPGVHINRLSKYETPQSVTPGNDNSTYDPDRFDPDNRQNTLKSIARNLETARTELNTTLSNTQETISNSKSTYGPKSPASRYSTSSDGSDSMQPVIVNLNGYIDERMLDDLEGKIAKRLVFDTYSPG